MFSILLLNVKCLSSHENEKQELNNNIIFDFNDEVLKVEKKDSWSYIDSNRINNYNDSLVRPNYIINDSMILFNDLNGNIVALDLSSGNIVSRYDFKEDYRWKVGKQCYYHKIKNYYMYSSELELLIFDPTYSVKFDIKRKFNDEYINELGLYPDSLKYIINSDSTIIFSELFCTKIHSTIGKTHIILDTCYIQ